MMKYFTKKELIKINNNSIKQNKNRTLEPKILKKLPNKLFPISLAFVHNDVEMRTMVIFNNLGDRGYLDMNFNEFNKLKSVPKEAVEERG